MDMLSEINNIFHITFTDVDASLSFRNFQIVITQTVNKIPVNIQQHIYR